MKKWFKWGALGLLILLLIAGGIIGATFRMPEFIGVESMEIKGKEGDAVVANVHTRVYNGNFFALAGKELSYVIAYRDTVLGRGEAELLELPSGDTTEVELEARMDLKGLFSVYQSMLRQTECALALHLDGKFTALNYRHSLELEQVIAPQELMEGFIGEMMEESNLQFKELEWKPQSLKQSGFGFVVEFKNPMPLPFTIQDLRMEFSREGYGSAKAGDWQLERPIAVQPEGLARIPGTAEVDNLEAGGSLFTGILKGSVDYFTQGKLVLGLEGLEFEIPIQGEFSFNLRSQEGSWKPG